MSETIETNVSEFLTRCNVSSSIRAIGETKRDDWTCDEWRVTLKGERAEYTFPYYTGTGHRKMKKGALPCTVKNKNSLAYEQWERANMVAVAPHVAGVLHSLIMDSSAIDQSFSDWCSDYGFDEDSRKALQIYSDCCEIGRKLRNLFAHAQREELRELVAEY